MNFFIDERTLDVCARRRVLDVSRLRQHLVDAGHTLVADACQADRVYLFTCAFNTAMEEKSLETVIDWHKRHGDKLVVSGCILEIEPGKVRERFAGPTLNNRTIRALPVRPIASKDIGVSWGCLGHCTYCVDKKAVGDLQSRPLAECTADLVAGLEHGYRSFRIVSDDLGAWGKDINSDFITLLEALVAVDFPACSDDYRLHLLEVNTQWLHRQRHRLQVFSHRRIGDVLVGVQSLNDRVLKLMKRGYSADEAREMLTALKNQGKRVGVHILIAFPTETWEEFQDSLNGIISLDIDFGFIFQYSDMEGAPSYHLYPKVEDADVRLEAARAFLERRGYDVQATEMRKLNFIRVRVS